jgi:hypothetical protein
VIVSSPGLTPPTTPEPARVSTVAILGLLLIHVPPTGLLFSVIVDPWHTVAGPVIAAGNGFTVIVVTVIQVVGRV